MDRVALLVSHLSPMVHLDRPGERQVRMNTPQAIADTFHVVAGDFERARDQNHKPRHIFIGIYRAAIQAARLTIEAAKEDLFPGGRHLRDWIALIKRPITDNSALGFWKTAVVPYLASQYPSRIKPNSSAFDFPEVKTDAEGRILGLDGKPLKQVRYRDPRTGLRGWRLNGEPATVVDDYDQVDHIAHLRTQATNYADACRLLAHLADAASGGVTGRAPKARGGKRTRKRAKRSIPTERELQALEFRSRGYTYAQIAAEMGIHKSRVGQLLKSAGKRQAPSSRSANLQKAVESHPNISDSSTPARRTRRQRKGV
jgi:DNA-binding CsgD family transcriptional regulator